MWATPSPAIEFARNKLRTFVIQRAYECKGSLGVGYRPSSCAPATFEDLCREVRMCSQIGLPVRVSSLHNEHTILGPEINMAFRFWHDCTHLELNAGFDRDGELAVGQEQLRQLEVEGNVTVQSLVWRLLFAETIGQTECTAHLGVFPINQWEFTLDYLQLGLREAIRLEGRRQNVLPLRLWGGSVRRPRDAA